MIDMPDETTESSSAIAMRLMVRLGKVPNTPKFSTTAMLEIAKLFAQEMPREKMLDLLRRLDELETL